LTNYLIDISYKNNEKGESMRKAIVFLSLALGYVSVIRLVFPTSPLQVIGINEPIAWFGFAVASLGILCDWEWLQLLNLRLLFHSISLLLLGITVLAITSPTYNGLLPNYIHFADNFVTLESAIILWLLGDEQHADKEKLPFLLYVGFGSEYVLRVMARWLEPLGELSYDGTHA
jgi:hypothetical protein